MYKLNTGYISDQNLNIFSYTASCPMLSLSLSRLVRDICRCKPSLPSALSNCILMSSSPEISEERNVNQMHEKSVKN